MKPLKDGETTLRKVLRAAYREKDAVHVDDLWQAKVMSHIRNLGPMNFRMDFSAIFRRLAWRLTPAVCFLILILFVVLINFDFTPEYELTKVYMTDTVTFVTEQLWGV